MTHDREAHETSALPKGGHEHWTRFLSGFVHELKTPLASLSMIAEMLAREDGFHPGERASRHVVNLQELVREMRILVDDAATLARLESGRTQVVKNSVSLTELVDRAAAAARSRGWEHGISLSTELDPGLPEAIRTDRDVLEEALADLLETGNLIAERRLTLRVAVADAALTFTVEPDRGCAPGQDPETLFDPFSGGLSRAVRHRRGGRPLAPALARELARVLGGDVEAVTAGERTVCVLRLPL